MNKTNIFQDDEPKCLIDDAFDFKHQAWQIANMVAGENTMNHTSVGLSGGWGTGKTSMLKMIQGILQTCNEKIENLKEYPIISNEKPVIVWFDPWFFGNESEVINLFFIRLAKELFKQEHPARHNLAKLFISLGNWIEPFSNILESVDINVGFAKANVGKVASSIKKVTDKLVDKIEKNAFDDFFEIKEHIINILKDSKKKIIILIDDLDRLQMDEALTMLKIIRLMSEFPNINFVIGYDEAMLASTINDSCGGYGIQYIRKMVNIPVPITVVESKSIDNYLLNSLFKEIKYNERAIIDAIKEEYKVTDIKDIPIISVLLHKTQKIRDVKRISNLFKMNLHNINHVNPIHYLGLCIVYYYYYNEYLDLVNDNSPYVYLNKTEEGKFEKDTFLINTSNYHKIGDGKYLDDDFQTILTNLFIDWHRYKAKIIDNGEYPFGWNRSIALLENEKYYFSFLPKLNPT